LYFFLRLVIPPLLLGASVSVGPPAKSGTAGGGVGRGDDVAVKTDTAARPPVKAVYIAASPYLAMASLLLLLLRSKPSFAG
jgi:hypothetical protein